MSKHTEGPWYIGADDAADCPDHKNSGLAMIDTGRSADWPIARLCEWNNASLIAAAPDLLEACRAAKKYLEPDLVEPGRTVFWKLVNAIQKAEKEPND